MVAARSQAVEGLITRLHAVSTCRIGWTARCPAHEDRDPSLSIRIGRSGRELVKCHDGCTAEGIVALIGLALADLFPPIASARSGARGSGRRAAASRPSFVMSYDYVDSEVRLLYQACRFAYAAAMQLLIAIAHRVCLALAHACGPFGIADFGDGPCCIIVRETPLRVEQVTETLRELAAFGFIERDAATTCVVHALALNSALVPKDPTHRRAVPEHLLSLPPSSLVTRFRFAYAGFFVPSTGGVVAQIHESKAASGRVQ